MLTFWLTCVIDWLRR